jgi:hypothetical protein
MRVTYRTALVLKAIAKAPGISNLDVAPHAQINDQVFKPVSLSFDRGQTPPYHRRKHARKHS